MWTRIRFDIGWRDLGVAAAWCVLPGSQSAARQGAERAWGSAGDALITLSVRSAFDLLLRALKLEPGSEILLTALTVPDMVAIVRSHGLVPVPVDTDGRGGVDLGSLQRAIGPRSRLVVVAHLWGGRVSMDDVLAIVRPHRLMVVEDSAQAFERLGDQGHAESDAVMYSFGPIKTATALAGAVVRVADPDLRRRMARVLAGDGVQSRWTFAKRVGRFAVLKMLSGQRASAVFYWSAARVGLDVDSLVNSMGRGFSAADVLRQLRTRPSTPLLKLLRRRWRTYDFDRVERRRRLGQRLDARIGLRRAEGDAYWVYPLFVPNPRGVCERLRAAGFDATNRSRMIVVPGADDGRVATKAHGEWQQVVFPPWYSELTDDAVDRMASLIDETASEASRQQRGKAHYAEAR